MTAVLALKDGPWSLERLADEIFYNLAFYEESRYYEQARQLKYKIPITKPSTTFKVSLADLTDRVVVELENSTNRGRAYALRNAVGRIFENVDYNYYHLSIKRRLVVELTE